MRRMLFATLALVAVGAFAVFAEDPTVSVGVTIAEAYKILGSSRIVLASDAAHRWGLPQPDPTVPLPLRYHRDTLERCADENESTASDWRLVYVFGLSLNDQLKQIAEVRPKIEGLRLVELRPEYGSRHQVVMNPDAAWMSERPEAGYCLVDFTPRLTGTDWYDQGYKVAAMRSIERLLEAAFVEVVVSAHGSALVRIKDDIALSHRGPSGPTNFNSCEPLRVRVLAHNMKVLVALKFVDGECCCAGGTHVYRRFDF